MFSINENNLPTTLSEDVANKELKELQEKKIEVLAATGRKSQYIREKVEQNHSLWWDAIVEDLKSPIFEVRRSAQIEFNKLQCRILPTELTSPEGEGLVMKVISYMASENNEENNKNNV